MTYIRLNTPDVNSSIRILHAVPNAPNIDVYANGSLISSDLSFSSISNYLNLSPGTYPKLTSCKSNVNREPPGIVFVE